MDIDKDKVDALRAAWALCQQTERYGLEFGKLCYELQQEHTAQGSRTGGGLRATLHDVGIPYRTAYWWIDRYLIAEGLREPKELETRVEKRVERAIEERIVSEAKAAEQEKLNRVAKNGSQLRTLQHMKVNAPEDYAAVLEGTVSLKKAASYSSMRQLAEKRKNRDNFNPEASATGSLTRFMEEHLDYLDPIMTQLERKLSLGWMAEPAWGMEQVYQSTITWERYAVQRKRLAKALRDTAARFLQVAESLEDEGQVVNKQRVLTGEQVCESS